MWATRLFSLIASVVLGAAECIAAGDDDVFFGHLPEGFQATIARCVDTGACDGIADLNHGPQLRAITMWDREIATTFPVEPSKGRLLVDAAQFERLIGRYYLWPEDVPKQGEIDIRSLPGLTVGAETDAAISLYPEKGFTRELTLGGQRIVAPEEFDRPGNALFGEFRTRFDSAFGADDTNSSIRLDSLVGAQSGLWQFVAETWIATDDAFFLRRAFAERPILGKALRLRAGLTDVTGCDVCFSGTMLGASVGSDSLQGLLYSPRDTAYLEVAVDGEIDVIEIVVNGRTVRTERAFPGFHTVVVTALVDGVNVIEVFGVNRATGHRRLLATEERLAAPTVLPKGRAEWRAEAGWAVDGDWTFDTDPKWREPFVQFTRSTGLGGGRQFESELFATRKAVLGEAALDARLGGGRFQIYATGSAATKALGGGAGMRFSERFGAVRIGGAAELCYDCFDADSFKITHGLDTRVQAYLSTPFLGWSANTSGYYATESGFGWNASLRHTVKGGTFEVFARQTALHFKDKAGWDDKDVRMGLRFTKLLGGERPGTIDTGIERIDGKWRGRAAFNSLPLDGTGVSYGATVEADDPHHENAVKPRVAANLGYQDDLVLASGHASYGSHHEQGRVGLNAVTGFVATGGDFVVTRTARAGGVFASGLTPGSSVIGDKGEIGRVDYLGQVHLNSLRRGEPTRVVLDEGLADGSPVTREAELLVVPGRIYGIGVSNRRQLRTYRITMAPDGGTLPIGLVLVDEAGDDVGYSGYDGIVTVDGGARSLSFEHEGQSCNVPIAGAEPDAGGLPQLVATCAPAKQ